MKKCCTLFVAMMVLIQVEPLLGFDFKPNLGFQLGISIENPKHEIDSPGEFNEQIHTQVRTDPSLISTVEWSIYKGFSFAIGYGYNYQTYVSRHSLDMPSGSIQCPEGNVNDVYVTLGRFTQNHFSIPVKIRYTLSNRFSISAGVDIYKYSDVSIVSEVTLKNFYGPERPCEYYIEESQRTDVSDQYQDTQVRKRISLAYHIQKFNVSIDIVSRNEAIPLSQFQYPIISNNYMEISVGYQIFN